MLNLVSMLFYSPRVPVFWKGTLILVPILGWRVCFIRITTLKALLIFICRAIVVARGSFIGCHTEDSIKGINRCALVGKSRTSYSRSRINCQKITANVDVEQWVKKSREDRIRHLEDQALWILKSTIDSSQNPAFPCALIAGDVVRLNICVCVCVCI
jgi:hypothetical protein